MKFLSSLKAWKKRGNIKQIRRGKQVILIDPDNPKFKAKQGFKKKSKFRQPAVFFIKSYSLKNASFNAVSTSAPDRPAPRK